MHISKKASRSAYTRTDPDVRYVLGGAYGDELLATLDRAGRGWVVRGDADRTPRTIREIRQIIARRRESFDDDPMAAAREIYGDVAPDTEPVDHDEHRAAYVRNLPADMQEQIRAGLVVVDQDEETGRCSLHPK
jgi:hypothetical protein